MAKLQIRFSILMLLLLATFAVVSRAHRYKLEQVRQVHWDDLPKTLGSWVGQPGRFDPIYGVDPADSSVLRVYREAEGPPVFMYTGFHRDLPTTLDYHTPELCYPAQGWTILATGRDDLGTFRGFSVHSQEILVEKQGERRLVMWWYHAGSQPFQKRIRQVYRLVIVAMFTGRTDGAIVRLETPLDGLGEQAARKRLGDFSRLLLPALERALPR